MKKFSFVEVMVVVVILITLSALAAGVVALVFQKATVVVSGEEVFRGMALCVEVKSAGAATSVTIGVPCRFPGQHYTAKDIEVTIR